ncbi:acyltransferase family protein [Terriglobus tenax]|uniref:acyltransferase family protein n=1 Tax=Terriglobus tenax TaxID=1111115 RepID=UPI0021E0B70E|nr:acyltransferase [Terriglobus tenax]
MSSQTAEVVKTRSPYYVALDGLRAIAVILVFFQHYGAGRNYLFGWGWTGVDIFFVLSGFLITGILFDSRHKEHRYRNFYIRRTLRIFPLYYLIWCAVLLLTPLVHCQWNWRWALWPSYLGNYARFLFLHTPGDPYRFDKLAFGPSANAWLGYNAHLYIGHFWSLCVEEQFYLIWPFVVFRIRRRETLMKVCLAVLLLSPIFRSLLTWLLPPDLLQMEILYRGLLTRLDALLLGGLIALALRGKEKNLVDRVRRPLLFLSAGLITGLSWVAVKVMGKPYNGSATDWVSIFGYSFIDLLAAGLILECIHSGSLLGKVLSWKPLRALGIISYGFYIYHDLLHDFFADFAHRLFPSYSYSMTMLTAFTGTLCIATISYLGFERPLLKLKDRFTEGAHTAPMGQGDGSLKS